MLARNVVRTAQVAEIWVSCELVTATAYVLLELVPFMQHLAAAFQERGFAEGGCWVVVNIRGRVACRHD